MDSFIDDEINSSNENEPVLLDIKDLLHSQTTNMLNQKEDGIYLQSNLKYLKPLDHFDEDNEFLIEKTQESRNETGNNQSNVFPNFLSLKQIFLKYKNLYNKLYVKTKNKLYKKNSNSGELPLHSSVFSEDCLNILANRLYYSKVTSYIYVFVFLLNVFILAYGFFVTSITRCMVCAEIFVLSVLLLEVSLRLIVEGKNYFDHFDGLFDVIITFISTLLFINSGDLRIFFTNQLTITKSKNKEIEEIISQGLMAIRFAIQLFRMITLVMHHKRVKSPSANIDFTLLNLPNQDTED